MAIDIWPDSQRKSIPLSPCVQDFNKPVGVLSQSVFIPGSTRALTGTSEGCGVVWEVSRPAVEGNMEDSYTTAAVSAKK